MPLRTGTVTPAAVPQALEGGATQPTPERGARSVVAGRVRLSDRCEMLTRMGVDVSELHRLVPAAHEIDLLEQHDDEVLREWYGTLCEAAGQVWGDEPDQPEVDESAGPAGESDEGWTLNHASAVAYVLRELGGQVDRDD